jgi:hypothetical protein
MRLPEYIKRGRVYRKDCREQKRREDERKKYEEEFMERLRKEYKL